jgi:NitT/TauT family transport system substrate-binding protein
MKKKWLVALVLVFLVTVIFPNHPMAQDEVRIGYLSIVMSLPTFVALEKGFFQEQGLKVVNTPFEAGTLLIDALVTGRIDVSAANSILPHWLAEQNLPGTSKVFLVYGSLQPKDNTFILVVAKDAPFKEIKDLKGKKVATFPGMQSVALAKAVLRPYFDPDKDVIMMQVPPGNIVQALAAGQIDAYFAPEPLGMIAMAQGVGRYLVRHPLEALNLQNGTPGGGFTFNSKFLKAKPLVAKKVKAAIYKGVDFINTNEQEARKFLVTYTNIPEPFAMKIPFDRWSKVEQFNKSSGQAYFEVLKKEGLFQKHIDTTQLYYQD